MELKELLAVSGSLKLNLYLLLPTGSTFSVPSMITDCVKKVSFCKHNHYSSLMDISPAIGLTLTAVFLSLLPFLPLAV